MKKRIILTVLGLSVMVLASGCKGKEKDINVDDYVTLGEYKGIEYTPASTEVTEEDFQAAIADALEKNPASIKIMDAAVKDGDTVNIDYKGILQGETEPFEGGTDTGADLTIGSGGFIEGFEDGLVGSKPGDTVQLNLKFPEDYREADAEGSELNGRAVDFSVTVNYIDGGDEDAVYNDEFVQRISDFENIKDYEADVRVKLDESKKEEVENKKLDDIFSKVMENCKISEVPDTEFKKYRESFVASYEYYASMYNMDLEGFLSGVYGMDMEEFNAAADNNANTLASQALVYEAIAKAEGITVTDEEFEKGLEEEYKNFKYDSAAAFKEQAGDSFRDSLLYDKVYEFILESAVVVNSPE